MRIQKERDLLRGIGLHNCKGWQDQICSVSQEAGGPGEPMVQFQSEDRLLENSLLLRKVSLFVLFRPSTDWMWPITQGRAICFTQSSLNCMLISSKTPSKLTWTVTHCRGRADDSRVCPDGNLLGHSSVLLWEFTQIHILWKPEEMVELAD